jgi:hypothetical protein
MTLTWCFSIRLISACFWLPGFLKGWQVDERTQLLDQHLKERLAIEPDGSETTAKESTSDETTDSEKSKDDFEKIAKVVNEEEEEEAGEIVDDATKKNK